MATKKVLSFREVISTNPDILQRLQSDVQEMMSLEKGKLQQQQIPLWLSYTDFLLMFARFGTYSLYCRKRNDEFVIDGDNEPMLRQLYLYILRSEDFEGDLHKGIMLQGKYGCGKTIIMETYERLHNHLVRMYQLSIPMLTFIKSHDLQTEIIKKSVRSFATKPLIIDEFGRESKTVQDFGNILHPITELLSIRSDIGSITHGTSNYSFTTLASESYYGAMIGDRLRSMFNFIELKGDSRRR